MIFLGMKWFSPIPSVDQKERLGSLLDGLGNCHAAAYHERVKKVFEPLEIGWDVIESDVKFLNTTQKVGSEQIAWVRDAAHMLMRAIATPKKT